MATPIRVLLIEDSLAYARVLTLFLEEDDASAWEVKHVTYLREALQCLNQESFDVAVSDLRLLDHGNQKCETVKLLREKNQRIPLVILSGYSEKNICDEALKLGADKYLSKDIVTSKILREAILDVLAKKNKDQASKN